MFSPLKSVLIPNVSIHDDDCFVALLFKNKRQFSFLIESNLNSLKPYVEYHIDLGEPKLFGYDSDAADKVQLIEKLHLNRLAFEGRIAILHSQKYKSCYIAEHSKLQVTEWVNDANENLKDFCLINEVFDEIKRYAKRYEINFQEPKQQENCLMM